MAHKKACNILLKVCQVENRNDMFNSQTGIRSLNKVLAWQN